MQHWNSFSTLYTPFQSYFLPVNHILLVRVGKTGQYWWVIVYNSLRTHDLHQYKSFFILCFLKLNPCRRVTFKRSLMEVPKEVNMWNPGLFRQACKQTRTWRNVRWDGRGVEMSRLGHLGVSVDLNCVLLLWQEATRACGVARASRSPRSERATVTLEIMQQRETRGGKKKKKNHTALQSFSCRQLREEDYGPTFISFS